MITNEFSLSPLDINQFHSLFTNNIDQETLALLGKSATDGNLDSIDILFNLALRTDNIDMEKRYSPSRLLYMAGSAMTSKMQRQELYPCQSTQS
ncbi:hypothetical protein [Lonsdalea quercina]|uniref:hypothetical protein n=1 Tax=Lonsdalea quercina TaxID=71657 RepID=UPI003976914A